MDAPRWLEYLDLDDLRGHPENPKDHDLATLGASFERFGFTEPPLIDERTGLLEAGHGRLERLAQDRDAGEEPPEGITVADDGRWLVPVVRGWASGDDDEARAYLIGSNRIGEGLWHDDRLGSILSDLRSRSGLDGIGFTPIDVDAILARSETPTALPPTPAPEVPQARALLGDVWTLGEHRLIVGDSRSPDVVARLLDGAEVNVAFTSPPYADRRKYDQATGFRPIPPEEYVEWFAPVAANVAEHLADDGSWFVNVKAGADALDTHLYVLDLVIAHARRWGWHYATEFCWERPGIPGRVWRRFKNEFEPVYQFARGDWKIRPEAVRHESANVPIYDHGRPWSMERNQGLPGQASMTYAEARPRARPGTDNLGVIQGTNRDVGAALVEGLAYPGNRLPTFAGTHEATGHSAAFPVGLPAWFVRAFSDPGDTVYDPFAGSGSTLMAAQQERRRGFGVELSPQYADVILDRWERHGGEPPRVERATSG